MQILQNYVVNVILHLSAQAQKPFQKWERKTLPGKQCEKPGFQSFQVPTGLLKDIDEAIDIAKEIGYPVIIKATAGGGGKGIRVARNEEELVKGINITQQEAVTAFGNPGVYIGKIY